MLRNICKLLGNTLQISRRVLSMIGLSTYEVESQALLAVQMEALVWDFLKTTSNKK